MTITWPDLELPPINLYNAPKLNDKETTMTTDNVDYQLIRLKAWETRLAKLQLAEYPEIQYLDLLSHIRHGGHRIHNDRTGVDCITHINADMTYDVGGGYFPLPTTRKLGLKTPIGELLGYLRAYTNANDFAALGAKSWYMNANQTQAWLDNPHRKGEDDCGQIYGAVARQWPTHDGGTVDLLTKIVNNLKAGKDDRGEILTDTHQQRFSFSF